MAWLEDYLAAARSIARAADDLVPRVRERRSDVAVNVHAYAWGAQERFLRTYYADGRPRVLALSMNPALNGGVQTGLSFTDAPTARALLPGFDGLVERPTGLRTDRVEMSGRKLKAWADAALGGLPRLYERVLFGFACPVAVLRGPRRLNVPLAALRGRARAAADAFYEVSAPRLVRAARPLSLLFFGGYAAQRWARVVRRDPGLASIPTVSTHHPAARITDDAKFRGWTAALERAEGRRGASDAARGDRRATPNAPPVFTPFNP